MSEQPSSTPAASPRPRTSIGVIFLVLFLDLVGFSILFPLYADMLAYYGSREGGVLTHAIAWVGQAWPQSTPEQREALFGGLLGAGYSLLQFLCAPLWGRLSDRFGRRPILLLSVTGSCLAYALWVFAGSFGLLLLSRLVAGLMGGSAACANAAVADCTATPRDRARGMAIVGMAFALGFILGPLIGALTNASSALRGLADRPALSALGFTPFSGTALVAFGLSAINLVWALASFHETLPRERRASAVPGSPGRTANPLRLFSSALGHGVMIVNSAFFLYTLLFAGLETTLVFLTKETMGFGASDNGPLFAWMGFVSALVQGGIFRRLAPRIGGRPLALAGLVVIIPGFLVLAALDWHHHARGLLWVGVSFLALATGLVFPSLTTLVSLATDARNQGLALGTFRSAGSLGRAVGPLVAALAYFAWRPAAPYLCGAVGIFLPMLLIARLKPFVHGAEAPAT